MNTILDYIKRTEEGPLIVQDMENEDTVGIITKEMIPFTEVTAFIDNDVIVVKLDNDREFEIFEDTLCDVEEILGDLIIILEDFTRITIAS